MSILDRLRNGVTAHSLEETNQLATEIAEVLPSEAVITLEGDLGAGKTTFVKGLASNWEIQETVTSPTFNIYQVYQGNRNLIHMDAYRLEPSDDIVEELMIDDFMVAPYCLAIEWPTNLGELPWDVFLRLRLEIGPNDSRIIRSH